jgi:hypothetical protein
MLAMDEVWLRTCSRHLEVVCDGGEMGLEAWRRISQAQMDGVHRMFEMLLAQFSMNEPGLEEESAPWLASYRRAVLGSTETSLRCFRTAAALQGDMALLADEILPDITRKLLSPIDEAASQEPAAAPTAQDIARRIASWGPRQRLAETAECHG